MMAGVWVVTSRFDGIQESAVFANLKEAMKRVREVRDESDSYQDAPQGWSLTRSPSWGLTKRGYFELWRHDGMDESITLESVEVEGA